jgi:aspartate kinase
MLVLKFGGTSVESATAIARVAEIVRTALQQSPCVVLVSAMGKTTNGLLAAAQAAAAGDRQRALTLVNDLAAQHHAEADQYSAATLINEHFTEIQELIIGISAVGELTPRSTDAMASFGERLSSLIVTLAFRHAGLPAQHVDARSLVVTDSRFTQAAPLFEETQARFAQRSFGPLTVMGGFIGANAVGVTTTLGRGGSDYSASLAGAALGAKEIQIWTDVDGMLTCDPRVLPGGHRVRMLSFAEAAELAYFGAKVLHPSTVLPAVEQNIPVRILNSRNPASDGTWIVAEPPATSNPARSISCKRGVTLVNIQSTRMLMAHGFLARIFAIFDQLETAVDMVATSEVSVSLTIDDSSRLEAILLRLREFAEVETEAGLAIVCLVGDNLRSQPGAASRAFHALGAVPVRMISEGASRRNISFVVADADLVLAVKSLHDEFFRELDERIFER